MNMSRVTTGVPSLYALLEVQASASREEIEESYHRIVDLLGPGSLATYAMMDGDEETRLREQVDEAYRTLTDPDSRAAYDRARQNSSYPSVMVPQTSRGGGNLSVGHMRRAIAEADLASYKRDGGSREASGESLSERREVLPDDLPERREVALPEVRVVNAPEFDPDNHLRVSPSSSQRQPRAPMMHQEPKKKRRLLPKASIDVGPDTEFSGSLLRRLRESADGSLNDMAEITKISKRYITALEENDFDTLPAFVYVRGFVCEYARALGLDPRLVASSYMSLYRRYRGEGT